MLALFKHSRESKRDRSGLDAVQQLRDQLADRERREAIAQAKEVAKLRPKCGRQMALLAELACHVQMNRTTQMVAMMAGGSCSFDSIPTLRKTRYGLYLYENHLILQKSGEWEINQRITLPGGGLAGDRLTSQDPKFWLMLQELTPEQILRTAERKFRHWSCPLPA